MCGSSGQEPECSSGGSPGKGFLSVDVICAIAAHVASALASSVVLLDILAK
jgi:hypothetical protein